MAKFLDSNGLSRLIAKVKAALNGKVSKVISTDNAVVRFDGTMGDVQNSGVTINDSNHITATKFITSGGTSSQLVKGDGSLETSDNYVKYADTSYVNVETVGFKSKTRTFGGSGWYRVYQGYNSPIHLMLTRGYNSPAPEGYDLDIETYDVTLTDDLWGIATITQNAGYYNSIDNQEIQKIRVYGYNGAPSTNPNNTDKSKLCIDVYINDRSERYNNVYDVSGYCLQRGTTISGRFFNFTELTADNIEYAAFCQNFGNSKYYLEFTLVNGFKTNKSAHAQSFIKDGGTSSQFLLGDGSVTALKTVNSTSLLGSGDVAVQPTLVSGTNIKTINNTSILGSGNISVQTPLTFDSTPTANSANPVTSGGIKTSLDNKVDKVSSTDNAIVRFDGTTGDVQDSLAIVKDNGDIVLRNLVVHGTVTSNDSRYISSDNAKDIYFSIDGKVPLAIEDGCVRCGSGVNGAINLGASSIYWNNVYAKKYITQNGTASQLVRGDGTLQDMAQLAPYEAYLKWGGKNLAASYSPIDAAMVSELGAPRTAFLRAAGIVVEYSTDGGTTWQNYGATDQGKVQLFSTSAAFYTGKNTTNGAGSVNNMLRVTMRTEYDAGRLYTVLNKFVILVSTSGSTGSYCTIRCRTQQDYEDNVDNWVVKADHAPVGGWTGYNVINIENTYTYGNTKSTQYGEWQFIFGYTGFSGNSTGLYILKIMGFGGVGWTTPSNMAKTGHLYNFNALQDAEFPSKVTASSFIKSGGTSSQFLKADGSVDSNTYLQSNQISYDASTTTLVIGS